MSIPVTRKPLSALLIPLFGILIVISVWTFNTKTDLRSKAALDQETTIGSIDAKPSTDSSKEFACGKTLCPFTFKQSGISDLPKWIGFSKNKSQKILLTLSNNANSITANQTYQIQIIPTYVSKDTTLKARVRTGTAQLLSGNFKTYTKAGYDNLGNAWIITAQLQSPTVAIELATDEESGFRYMYIDALKIKTLSAVLPTPSAVPTITKQPRITAGWIELGGFEGGYKYEKSFTQNDLRERIDMMAKLGMDTVIITYTEHGGFFYPSEVSYFGKDKNKKIGPGQGRLKAFDAVDTILSQAAANNMRVFVGLTRAGYLEILRDVNNGAATPEQIQNAVNVNKAVATELWNKYSHYSSFYGWYITYEPGGGLPIDGSGGKIINPIARHLKSLGGNRNTPVLISPPINNYLTAEQIAASDVDIFAFQDSAGSGYVPSKGHTFNVAATLQVLPDLWKKQKNLITQAGKGKRLWSHHQLWERSGVCPGDPGSASKLDGCPYPATASNLVQEISLADQFGGVEKVTGYAIQFISDPALDNHLVTVNAHLGGKSSGGELARKLFTDYFSYLMR